MTTSMKLARKLRACIKTYPNFPKPGIQFEDVSGLLAEPTLCQLSVEECVSWTKKLSPAITKVAGLESRGFLLGVPIALELGVPFVMVRKIKKLPGSLHRVEYTKEYGKDAFEVQTDAFSAEDHVLLVDDLLATGGSIEAAARLIKMAGATPAAFSTIVHLTYLPGLDVLTKSFPALKTHALLPLKDNGQIDELSNQFAVLAFDIGSGTTKASLVLVDKDKTAEDFFTRCCAPDPDCVISVLMSKQVDILVGVDYQMHGHISTKTQTFLLDTIQQFMSEAKVLANKAGYASIHVTGIATAVFRDAQNADDRVGKTDLLERMQQTMHCQLRCIDANEEARLGWKTAMLLKSKLAKAGQEWETEKLCWTSQAVWDLGGGSSQLSWATSSGLSLECVNMGTSHALKALENFRKQQQQPSFEDTDQDLIFHGSDKTESTHGPAPCIKVTFGEACQLIEELHDQFRRGMSDVRHLPQDFSFDKAWALGPRHVMCIGGPTSAFAAIQTVLDSVSSASCESLGQRSHLFTTQDVETALAYVTGQKTFGSKIRDAWHFMVVPKLCLVLASMRAMGIHAALFIPSNGSTLALATEYVRGV